VLREVSVPYKPTGRPSGRPKKAPPDEGARPDLTEKQWVAIQFVVSTPHASDAEIARAANVSRQAVHQWRSDDHFEAGCAWLEVEQLSRALLQRAAEGDARREAERDTARLKHLGTDAYAFEFLHFRLIEDYRQVEAKNPGGWSVVSMADGKTYTDPEAYVRHLKEGGYVPVGHYPAVNSPEWKKLQDLLKR
jgi:hypothetical protein